MRRKVKLTRLYPPLADRIDSTLDEIALDDDEIDLDLNEDEFALDDAEINLDEDEVVRRAPVLPNGLELDRKLEERKLPPELPRNPPPRKPPPPPRNPPPPPRGIYLATSPAFASWRNTKSRNMPTPTNTTARSEKRKPPTSSETEASPVLVAIAIRIH